MDDINHFEINSKLTEVRVMASHFQEFCSINKLDEDISGLLELVLVEAVNNIIIHSYESAPGFYINAEYEISNSQISIILTDSGKEFSNANINSNNNDETELAEGNWGLDLINSLSDEIIRTRAGDKNTLIIKKNITF